MLRSKFSFSSGLLLFGSALGIIAFTWPIYIPESDLFLLQPDAARVLALFIAAIAVGVVAIEISSGAMDSKSVAVLGVLAALIAALRLVGAGAVGVEPMWFLLILAGYSFGGKFGFSLGVIAMASSAIITGGIGVWLPFQMIAAGWIGWFAGAVGVFNNRRNIQRSRKISLILVGICSSLIFGLLMDLQMWPWLTGTDTQLSYISGAAVTENAQRFLIFHTATALSWDIPRAITTATLIALTANPILNSFQRAQQRLNLISLGKGQKAIA